MPLTPDDWAFLDEQRVARLATSDAAGRPHAVPICFACVSGRIYVPVDAKPKQGDPRRLKRLRNLAERPDAVLLADHYEEDWASLRWLMVRAEARILDPEEDPAEERRAALVALEGRYPQYAAMRLASLGLPVIALTPLSASRWPDSPTPARRPGK